MSDACFCDYDAPVFYARTAPKARKNHRCDECSRRIAPGELYERVAAKWDGRVEVCRTCSRCLALREFVQAHVPCFCWMHHNMIEDARETVAHYAHECPGLFMGFGRLLIAVRGRKQARQTI